MARKRLTDFSTDVMSLRDTIDGLSLTEMNAVYSLLKERHSRIQIESAGSFRIGDLVEFTASKGRLIRGSVDKINRKSISLTNCTGGRDWRVAPTMLRAV